MKPISSIVGHASCFIAYAIFGINIIVCKNLTASELISPLSIFCLRSLGAGLLFWILSLLCPQERVERRDLFRIFLASMLGFFVTQLTFLIAIHDITPMDCAITSSMSPVYTMIIAAIALREPISWRKALGVALSLCGILYLITSSIYGESTVETKPIGIVLIVLNCLSFSAYLGIFRPLIQKYSVVTFMKWIFLFAMVMSLPFSAAELAAVDYASVPTSYYLELSFLVVCATFISYFLIPVGQKVLRPTLVSMYSYVQPIIAIAISIAMGMDSLTISKVIAAVAVFGGVVMVNFSRARHDDTPRGPGRKAKSLAMIALFIGAAQASAQTSGQWSGILDAKGVKLKLVVHLSDDGTCALDSPDQGALGIPGSVYYISDDSVSLGFPSLMATYRAHVADGTMTGKFKQGFATMPLTLTQGELRRRRPQTPQPPYPYDTVDLDFDSQLDGAQLWGTLAMPRGQRPAIALVMVSGSGQQNRDEELFEHKPFAVIADHLARNGIATLRYDDRGVGSSQGLTDSLTTATNAADALSALRVLRTRGLADKYGIIGHSEGGTIAFMLAGANPAEVDLAVSLAGTAVRGDSLLAQQYRALMPGLDESRIPQMLEQARGAGRWMQYFLDYDPAQAIASITCPVFAANGDKDRQVDASQNMGALRRLLPRNDSTRLRVYPGLNHLFQHCDTGMPAEYAQIEETISPELLADLTEWLLSLKQ